MFKYYYNICYLIEWRKSLPTTVGSKSMKTALGTCFPAPVSLKNVLKLSSVPPIFLSDGMWPSGWIPCSRQYNSQHALPIWTPACPTWIEIHSRYKEKFVSQLVKYLVFIYTRITIEIWCIQFNTRPGLKAEGILQWEVRPIFSVGKFEVRDSNSTIF